jgi:hypothetical protein
LFPGFPPISLLGMRGLDGLGHTRTAYLFVVCGIDGLAHCVLGLVGPQLFGLDLFLGALSLGSMDLFAEQSPSAGERHRFHAGEKRDQSAPRGLAAIALHEHENHQDQEPDQRAHCYHGSQ